MNYKELSSEDKIAAIVECRFWRGELALVEQYIEALKTNNMAVIEEFESFCDSPQHIVNNKSCHERAFSAFGFTGKTFNERGWLEDAAFMECETFYFGRVFVAFIADARKCAENAC